MNGRIDFLTSMVGLIVMLLFSIVLSIVIVIDALSDDYSVPWALFAIPGAIITYFTQWMIRRYKNGKEKNGTDT